MIVNTEDLFSMLLEVSLKEIYNKAIKDVVNVLSESYDLHRSLANVIREVQRLKK